jgi:hypothetical protein
MRVEGDGRDGRVEEWKEGNEERKRAGEIGSEKRRKKGRKEGRNELIKTKKIRQERKEEMIEMKIEVKTTKLNITFWKYFNNFVSNAIKNNKSVKKI